MESHPVRVDKKQARKRTAQPETWKVNCAKKRRYSAKSLPLPPKCNHKTKSLKCHEVKGKLLREFHTAFYKHTSKSYQDAILLKCCTATPIQRKRPRTGSKTGKEFTTKFHIIVNRQKLRVCQQMFLGALRIKKGRITSLVAKSFKSGEFPVDKRGGDHRSHKYQHVQQSVHTFIQSLQCSEPHYCRGQTSRRYLSSDLNIRKLYRLYTESSPGPHAKESYFRTLFNRQYNLGFGSPQSDICSTCLQLKEKIKLEKDEDKKKNLIIEKRVHILRAKAFFSLLKTEEPGVKILSYDCQKNLALPKLPDQSCYYSRQLYLFNFTIVEGSSKCTLKKNNVFANLWTEDTYKKDSNTISSAVYHHLNKTDLNGIHTVRLIADGCGGQNKNKTMIVMCCKWLLEQPKTIKNVELVFPVTGHSYLPADRVFGNTEKRFRKLDTITSPQQYIDIITEQATLVKVGDDFPVYDFKGASESIVKAPGQWKINFSQCKRFFLRRSKRDGNVLVNGELFYKTRTGQYENICKKDKTISMLQMEGHIVNKGVDVKHLKLRDVNSLLEKHYGENWKSQDGIDLTFYSEIFDSHQNIQEIPDSEENTEMCEPQEESPLLVI